MAVSRPTPIPFPTSSFPGANPQESAGRLINCYIEELGEGGPAKYIWRRSPGLSQYVATAQSGYRGGLVANNLSFEAWANNASSVDASGAVTSIGNLPGTKKVSIARNQASPTPDVIAVDLDNGAYVLESASVTAATATATVSGSSIVAGDILDLTVLNEFLNNFPVALTYTVLNTDTTTTIATAFKNLINANTILSTAGLSATSSAAVITISQNGSIGNSTSLTFGTSSNNTGNETITFNPTTGGLSGGTGTPGAFVGGVPTAYNGQGGLPQPNSVTFQDGYLFFTTAAGKCYATALNSLTMNALTYITVQAKSDVTLLRAIAFSGLLFLFTTGSAEIWQDVANAAPAFPYGRIGVLEYGLIQSAAIAGFENGFSQLIWVAQDFGVYWLPAGSLAPIKASPPDLDRLIEAQIHKGNTLEAGCYIFAGKKFWTLSCPDWSWEFNLETKKWNERWSLQTTGIFGRWRATGGHPAFGKWLVGDEQSGNLLWIDDSNFTENGAVQLFRIESGPVKNFPNQVRVARADFDFDMGVGIAVANFSMTVTGAASGTGGVVRLAVNSTAQADTDDTAIVSGVTGTTEANGTWVITIIDATHIELQGSVFKNAYVSGGTAIDVTSEPNAITPTVAISMSKNGGLNWGNPLVRQLGSQGHALRQRASVTSMGLSGTMGVRWRLDVTDPVYTGFLGGTQASDPRVVGL
ncbi:MAG: hypothetical protein P4M05_19585 [Bradyrhizobium sp.]|nr:hypothetical protein [Bradyrhizobium sp.]